MGPEVKKKTDLHKPRGFADAFCFIDDLRLINDNGLFETFQRNILKGARVKKEQNNKKIFNKVFDKPDSFSFQIPIPLLICSSLIAT